MKHKPKMQTLKIYRINNVLLRQTIAVSIILFSLFAIVDKLSAQNLILQGHILDEGGKHEPLPFVSVMLRSRHTGVLADLDGKWKISNVSADDTLQFTYVGYISKKIPVSILDLNSKDLIIYMREKAINMKEVVILPTENPAHRIMRKVLENKKLNDWQKIHAFTYSSYNKFYVTSLPKDTEDKVPDNVDFSIGSDSEARALFDKQYLFLTESVVETKYMAPEKLHDKVVASRVSGFKDPSLSLLASQYNTFDIYKNLETVGSTNYLSPIADGAIKKYLYLIQDTLYPGNGDTVFVISYRPRRGTLFDGFKGLLYINTKQWAVQNVIARPVGSKQTFSLKISQEFEWMDNKHWFPKKINADYTFFSIKGTNSNLTGVGRSYLKDINLDADLKKREFTAVQVEIDPHAGDKDSTFWNKERVGTFGEKERTTYHVIDSVGKATKLDKKLKYFNALRTGRLGVGPIDIDLNRIIRFNNYEGFRLGAGAYTNDRVSRYFSVGGYGAYGFKDKALKYGTSLDIKPVPGEFFMFGGSYSKDVDWFGEQYFALDRKATPYEKYRFLNANNMVTDEQRSAYVRWRMLYYLQTKVSFSQTNTHVNSAYVFVNDDNGPSNDFHFTEASVAFRYAFREKLVQTLGQTFTLPTHYPILWLQYTRGLNGVAGGEYAYDKLDAKVEKSITLKLYGTSTFQLTGGKVWGNVPLFKEYMAKANFNKSYFIVSQNDFETMRINEFFNSQYVALFYTHSFEKLLFKTKKSRPILALHENIGFGSMANPAQHLNVAYKTMDKGYYESGVTVDNIYSTGLTSLGVALFYRYGPYAFDNYKDNFAVKLSLSYILL
jgi:hypothetical protein